MKALGIDIGGSGIKGAPVKLDTGVLAKERFRIPTPQPSTPDAVAKTVAKIVKHFSWEGPIGCTFPSPIRKGRVLTAANVDDSWIGVNGRKLLEKKTGCPVRLLNDADAAGIAEMAFGAGRGRDGVVFVLTLGTGLGTAIFVNGVLVPNLELGHMGMRLRKHGFVEAEEYASDRIRQQKKLSWTRYARRVNEYLDTLEALFCPDLFIIGGGISKKHEEFLPLLKTKAEVLPARLLNDAGIVGAALAARSLAQ
ncbi:MAG TPA: ROK family protein [Anaerolineae bacterium]|nr:ROK family protein [Anaerolineae bacterium]